MRAKEKVHYRRVGKSAAKTCSLCGHRKFVPIFFIGGKLNRYDYRCEIIGLENSIRYAVRDDCVCDKFAYFPKKVDPAGQQVKNLIEAETPR